MRRLLSSPSTSPHAESPNQGRLRMKRNFSGAMDENGRHIGRSRLLSHLRVQHLRKLQAFRTLGHGTQKAAGNRPVETRHPSSPGY